MSTGLNSKLATHSLRKSFAPRVYEQSGDIFLVQELLGHRTVSTTQRYLGVNYASAREAVEAWRWNPNLTKKTSKSQIFTHASYRQSNGLTGDSVRFFCSGVANFAEIHTTINNFHDPKRMRGNRKLMPGAPSRKSPRFSPFFKFLTTHRGIGVFALGGFTEANFAGLRVAWWLKKYKKVVLGFAYLHKQRCGFSPESIKQEEHIMSHSLP